MTLRLNPYKAAPEAMKAMVALENYMQESGLDAWRDSPLYSERERAALAGTEAVTLVSETHVPDAVYDPARQHFSEAELVKLTLCVATINAWNRVAISFRSVHPIHRTRAT